MTKQDLLGMPLHSEKTVGNFISILRVFGGWIYSQMVENQDNTFTTTSVFVPEELNCNTKSIN